MKSKVFSFLKEWMLIIAIAAGISGYFVYEALPLTA